VTLSDLAARIDAHLNRFADDERARTGASRLFLTESYVAGLHVAVVYDSRQGCKFLSGRAAERYLAWLDAGNVGRHFEMGEKP
jgi:hypothetical protein